MKNLNPFRSLHRERLLDLSSDENVARPGRLELFDHNDEIARRHRVAAGPRHWASDPSSWVNRHLQGRVAAAARDKSPNPDELPLAIDFMSDDCEEDRG